MEYYRLPFDTVSLNQVDFEEFGYYKDNEYSWQKEVRISWALPGGDKIHNNQRNSPYYLNIPNLPNLITEMGELKDYSGK